MRSSLLRCVLALVLFPVVLPAQVFRVGRDDAADGPRRSPVFGGAAFIYGRPTGEFRRYVDQGFGLDGAGRFKLDRRGILSLGIEGGWLRYGSETVRVPLSSTVGRINVDVTTANDIAFAGVGPQLMVPVGPIRPYVNGSVGFSYFFTRSSVEGSSNDNQPFAQTTNFDDAIFATTAGAGFYIPLGRGGEFGLDIGARYHNGGKAQYLREDSIIDRPGQTPLIRPIESETRLISWRLGFVAGLR